MKALILLQVVVVVNNTAIKRMLEGSGDEDGLTYDVSYDHSGQGLVFGQKNYKLISFSIFHHFVFKFELILTKYQKKAPLW